MLPCLTLLLVCQLLGELTTQLLGLPVPGPVIGLVILFVGLVVRGRSEPELEETADGILRHLSLLFVPAGVGVVQYLGLIADEWLPVTVALVVSTAVTIVVTAGAMRLLGRFATAREAAR